MNLRHITLLLLSSFFIYNSVLAQNGKLKGVVKDSLKKPVYAATVFIEESNQTALTDERGSYAIDNITPGKHKVVVTKMGSSPATKQFEIKGNETVELNFELQGAVYTLGRITVNGVPTINGMGHLNEVNNGIIYSGKKNEVLILDSLNANTAQNNPRQVLGRVPGSNYSETEGSGFPSNGIGLRGLNPTQSIETNTRQNGYNITADLYGYPESYYSPPLEAIDRVEIIRGASSLQFGPQFGGVINYVIKNGPETRLMQFTTEQTGGSFGLFNSFNSIGGTYKKWNYFAFFQYKGIEGWRPNSDVQQGIGFAKIEYRATARFKVGLEYSLLRNRIHMPGGLDDAEFAQDPRQSTRSRNWLSSPWNILALTSEYRVSEKTLITFKSALNISARDLVWRNEDGGPQVPDSISPLTNSYVPREVEHEGFKNSTTELRLLTSYNIGKTSQTLAAGVRFFYGWMSRQEGGPGSTGIDFDMNLYGGPYENDLDFTTTNFAPFVENTFHIGKRLSVTPGFRFEFIKSTAGGYITGDDSAETIINVNRSQTRYIPLGGIGIQFTTTKNTNLYANISQAYRPIDYSSQYPIGTDSKVDPNLKDINGYNADLGWRGSIKSFLNFDIGGFYLAYNNGIGLETLNDASGVPYTLITNIANNVHKGIETYVELNVVKLFTDKSRIGDISFFNSYAYDEAKYVAGPFKDKWVEFAPQNIDRLGITYSMKYFSTTFLISSTSKSYTDANNTVFSPDAEVGIIPSYMVMDWSATVKIHNYNIKFGVNNLADKKYFTLRTNEYPGPGIIPAIGRSLYIGFGAKF